MIARLFCLVLFSLVVVAPVAAPAALPPTCADPCTITARSEGYVVPAVVIASGARVTFASADITHVTADGAGAGAADGCFAVASRPGLDGVVTLAIVGGALVASTSAGSAICASATALPDGSFALPFYCKIHPNMRGALGVRP